MWVRVACRHISKLSRLHNSCRQRFSVTKCPKTVLFGQFHRTVTVRIKYSAYFICIRPIRYHLSIIVIIGLIQDILWLKWIGSISPSSFFHFWYFFWLFAIKFLIGFIDVIFFKTLIIDRIEDAWEKPHFTIWVKRS